MKETDQPEEEYLEPTLDVETSPMMEPSSILSCEIPSSPPPKYWQAQSFAQTLHEEFETLQKKGDTRAMRQRFYLLARYYGRTMAILRHALQKGNAPLIKTALYNLVTLHQPLHHMHELSPKAVPFAVTLDKTIRGRLVEDLLIQALHDSVEPLAVEQITERVNRMHVMEDTKESTIHRYLNNFVEKGHVQMVEDKYSRSKRSYSFINLDRASLQALLGPELYAEFEQGGFPGLSNISGRTKSFKQFFERFTGCDTMISDLFIAAAKELLGPPSLSADHKQGRHLDLTGSIYPRPYQHDAFTIFRGHGYKGQVIEAPTGSGKTMIGMMCIQDWLGGLSIGESILILVPTVNYEQQWVGELCYKPIGLGLSPNEVFTGTPSSLESLKKQTGLPPSVMVMTYSALAQMGSPTGKGGFDIISIEKFLQGSKVQYVILDEVHKLVEDLRSVSADVAKLFTEWLRDGSIRGIIGFSGTASAYRNRFSELGLQLVYTLPAADLIAYGFVAPFSEFGVPFAFSDREKRIRTLLEEYKSHLREFISLLGSDRLRKWFAALPMDSRISAGLDLLGIYASRKNRKEALAKRFQEWEAGEKIGLNEMALVSIVQILYSWSDRTMITKATAGLSSGEKAEKAKRLQELLRDIDTIRSELKERIYFPDFVKRLSVKGFGTTLQVKDLQTPPTDKISVHALLEQTKDRLAATAVGLYSSLKNFYFRVGEGRVDSIKSVMAAERATRAVNGVIIFDKGKRIKWERGVAVPGYSGVAGVFAQVLGEKRVTPMAVLSSEIYLPWSEKKPLTEQISHYIKKR